MGLNPETPGSCPRPKADTKLLSHPGIPRWDFLTVCLSAQVCCNPCLRTLQGAGKQSDHIPQHTRPRYCLPYLIDTLRDEGKGPIVNLGVLEDQLKDG